MTAASELAPQNRMLAATEASRASLNAAGVNGRFREEGAATAPSWYLNAAPTVSHGKSAASASINAVAVTEPEACIWKTGIGQCRGTIRHRNEG
jgi:hypothetical protein